MLLSFTTPPIHLCQHNGYIKSGDAEIANAEEGHAPDLEIMLPMPKDLHPAQFIALSLIVIIVVVQHFLILVLVLFFALLFTLGVIRIIQGPVMFSLTRW